MPAPRRKRFATALAGAAIALAAPATGHAASIVPPDVQAVMAAQLPAQQRAAIIEWEVEREGATGFTSLTIGARGITLRWKGPLPERIRALVDQAGTGVPVAVLPARYSRAELAASTARVASYMRTHQHGPVDVVGGLADGSGIRVAISPDAEATVVLRDLGPLPTPVTIVRGAPVTLNSRLDDTPAWWGGARIVSQEGWDCTSGFGVTSTVDGKQYILTAAHCAKGKGDVVENGQASQNVGGPKQPPLTLGPVALYRADHDIMAIATKTGSGGTVYDGGVDLNGIDISGRGLPETHKAVAGWDYVHGNDSVCVSGSVEGISCGYDVDGNELAITANACRVDGSSCHTVSDLVEAHPDAHKNDPPPVPGDSGAPVFKLAPNNKVTALGTLTGILSDGSIVFQDFATARADFKITVNTG